MNKLPQELLLAISREIKDMDWQLDSIMHVLESELEVRERAFPHGGSLVHIASRVILPTPAK